MRRSSAWSLPLLVAVAALVTGCLQYPEQPPAERVAESLLDAPPFELPDMDGKTWRSSDLSGATYVVEFWATWCVPCEELKPMLERLAGRYQEEGLQILAVTEEAKPVVRSYLAGLTTAYPILLDEGGKVTKAWEVHRLPTTVLVRKGKVLGRWVGAIDGSSIELALEGIYGK